MQMALKLQTIVLLKCQTNSSFTYEVQVIEPDSYHARVAATEWSGTKKSGLHCIRADYKISRGRIMFCFDNLPFLISVFGDLVFAHIL